MVAAILSQQYYPGTFAWLDSKIFDKFLKPFVVNELKNKSGYAVPILQYCVDKGIALDDRHDMPDLLKDA
ncbi:MAG: hypothetical protein LBC04_00400 [Holosporaceae bacterium]|jgi:hypothetical protein|nr:hypothetical protein [Holosporaceae bacterium]